MIIMFSENERPFLFDLLFSFGIVFVITRFYNIKTAIFFKRLSVFVIRPCSFKIDFCSTWT